MEKVRRLCVQAGMRFEDSAKEYRFFHSYCLKYLPLIQASVVLGTMIYYAFFIWDDIIDPVGGAVTHGIRGVIVAPLLLLIASVLRLPTFEPYVEKLLIIAILSCNIGLAIIYSIIARGFDFGAVGVVLVLMFMFALLPLRFLAHLFVSFASLVAFDAAFLIAANAQRGMFLINNMCIGTAIFLGMFSVVTREFSARRQFVLTAKLTDSQNRIEDLLYSMLPKEIVMRMQAGEKSIADAYGEVSIVFADLVGFTGLTRKVSPNQLVEILNSLFTEFDMLAEQFNVEKIKTIGDAYMAVGGMSLNQQRKDHAQQAAGFALALQKCVAKLASSLDYDLNIRIGLHVGPVVAGVIGMKRPAFDCWGEAVNLASRLEHSAIPGGILISEQAYWRLKSSHKIDDLADIELKGIGLSRVFLLKNRNEHESGTLLQ